MVALRSTPDHSVRSALARLRRASGEAGPRWAFVRALHELTDALRALFIRSDAGTPARRGGPHDRFSRSQERNFAEIRRISDEAKQDTASNLDAGGRAARSEALRACRTQVRKVRIGREDDSDSPGGEG